VILITSTLRAVFLDRSRHSTSRHGDSPVRALLAAGGTAPKIVENNSRQQGLKRLALIQQTASKAVSPLPPPPSECRPRVTQLGAFIFLEHASPAARERDRFALKSHPSNSTRLRSQCPSKYFKNNFKNNTGQLDLKLLGSIQQTASQAVSPLPPPPSECRPRVPSSGLFLFWPYCCAVSGNWPHNVNLGSVAMPARAATP